MIKILVIDDKKSLSALIAQFLGKTYDVTTRENGLTALKWLQESNMPDLIITDLEMPEMGGLEFIRKTKDSGFFSDIPIMVLSCRDSSADRIECLKEGAEDFMVKPFNPEELEIRIENILKKTTSKI
ncbi:MAG: response regulator transcription factor [Cellulophaga sp.]